MKWLDTIVYILYGCGALILLLFIANLILAKTRGADSKWVRRLLYIVAIIAAVLGTIRSKFVYSETVFFADILVVLCIIIAFVLTPIFFKMNMVSIYQYLDDRFGVSSHKTGAWFFFISKMLGASVRLYLVCISLQLMVFGPLGIPFWVNVMVTVLILLLYTFRGGVKAVIWIDFLKTFCMLVSIILCTVFISKALGFNFREMTAAVSGSGMSRMFWFDDPDHPQFFLKQFFGGMFTLIAMTGLDQDMMQRSLACRNFKDSQKNVIVSALLQTVVIFLFLVLGVLLYMFAGRNGITETGDTLFPAVATSGLLPATVGILFVVGLVSCSFAAGGSALTAMTTSFTVDILGTRDRGEEKVK